MRIPSFIQDSVTARPSLTEKYVPSIESIPGNVRDPWLKAHIDDICISPIKSLGMLPLKEASVHKTGLKTANGLFADRSAMLALRKEGKTENGSYSHMRFSQRDVPGLVKTHASLERGKLVYQGPAGAISISSDQLSPAQGEEVKVRMFPSADEICNAVVENGPITAWVRDQLQALGFPQADDIDVLLQPECFERLVERMHSVHQYATTNFSDGGQMLTTSQRTLEWMNQEIRGSSPIDMNAFRPNIVIGGWPANLEDMVYEVLIAPALENGKRSTRDAVRMLFGGACVRCPVVQIDQQSGEMKKGENTPLSWLKSHRPPRADKPSSVTFGYNTVFKQDEYSDMAPKTIRVGDAVNIMSLRK